MESGIGDQAQGTSLIVGDVAKAEDGLGVFQVVDIQAVIGRGAGIGIDVVPLVELTATTRDAVHMHRGNPLLLGAPERGVVEVDILIDIDLIARIELHQPAVGVVHVSHFGAGATPALAIGIALGVDDTLNPRLVVLDIQCIATQILLLTRSTMDSQVEQKLGEDKPHKVYPPRLMRVVEIENHTHSSRCGEYVGKPVHLVDVEGLLLEELNVVLTTADHSILRGGRGDDLVLYLALVGDKPARWHLLQKSLSLADDIQHTLLR